jgi:hypothetical protein
MGRAVRYASVGTRLSPTDGARKTHGRGRRERLHRPTARLCACEPAFQGCLRLVVGIYHGRSPERGDRRFTLPDHMLRA